MQPKKKKNKYRAKKIKIDGICFDSQLEANYYAELKIRHRVGEITGFCRQPQFILQDGEGTVIKYKPDFIEWYPDGSSKVIECKGVETEAFIIRKKLFKKHFPDVEYEVVK